MAFNNTNSLEDFENTLLTEGVSKSTIERLRKEEITDWSTLAILTSDDISELGLPVGQKALVRNLTQRKPPSKNETKDPQPSRGSPVMSTVTDADRVASFSETATEYVRQSDVSRADDIYDDAMSLDQQRTENQTPTQADEVPPANPSRYPRDPPVSQKSEQRSKKYPRKPPVPLPKEEEDSDDIYDVPEDEEMDDGNLDDVYDVPDDTDGGDIYDESSLDSPAQNQPAARPTIQSYPKVMTKPSMTSDSSTAPKSNVKTESSRASRAHGASESSRASRSHGTSESTRASRSQGTSESTRASRSHGISESTRVARSHGTSESTRASRSHGTSESTRAARSNMTSASTNAPQQIMTSEPTNTLQRMTVPEESIQLPKAGGTSHMSKLLTMSEDIKNAAKNIMKFETKPAARPTIVKVDSSPMTGQGSVPDSRPMKNRLSGGFASDTGSYKQATPEVLPPRMSGSMSKGVHFPEEMLAPTGGQKVMPLRPNSIPDEEAPDLPSRQIKNIPRPQPSLIEGETTQHVTKIAEDNSGDHEVELNVSCLETEGKGKVVLELTTAHQDVVKPLPARILLLVDTSGSMGIKVGRRRRSKLNHLKSFVISMVKTLDDGDQAALVTFGEDSNVLLPMSEINPRTLDTLTSQLEELDKSFLSKKTDLSAGILTSLDVFGRVCKSQDDLLGYRNSIIVFSDGEINLGTQEPQRLVHEVREKIRAMSFGLDYTQNQWVSISTVVTGSNSTEIMHSLSKFCSSDAFYQLDTEKATSQAEVDFFLPVMMRKTAIAWNVALHVQSLNGATIVNADCTQENKVRLRGPKTTDGEKTQKAYFFYDIPAASEKHVGIVIDLSRASQNPEVKVLTATINFTGISGKRRTVIKDVTLADLMTTDLAKKKEALEDIYMHEARIVSQIAVSKAAEEIKSGRAEKSRTRLLEGQSDLQRLMESYGQKAEEEEVHIDITPHAESVIKNLQSLLDAIETATGQDEDVNGKNWIRMKVVSSAITREAPTTSDTVSDTDILCPLPKIRQVSSDNIRKQMVQVYRKEGVRNSSFVNMDHTLNELSHSLRMRPISE
ncbi:uncharacterized protein LOC110461270 isoform X2 [Mizuhopecten yessoensis]|uniref:uncharacterized protein LOC110461270 isoform X2 n=1 Tax=Mizuhopecten yessoensis TaxID=6573 RepID=UPI000B45F676|nr:uncharacterized protein LOC110461270 isoform X2 [Mizuhopecten yessoensis]